MNTLRMKKRIAEESPRLNARFAVVFYLLTILVGGAVFFIHEWLGCAVVTACYLGATALVYAWFKFEFNPVSGTLFVVRDRVRSVAQVPARERRDFTRSSQRS